MTKWSLNPPPYYVVGADNEANRCGFPKNSMLGLLAVLHRWRNRRYVVGRVHGSNYSRTVTNNRDTEYYFGAAGSTEVDAGVVLYVALTLARALRTTTAAFLSSLWSIRLIHRTLIGYFWAIRSAFRIEIPKSTVICSNRKDEPATTVYYAPAPRVGGIKRWCASDVCLTSEVWCVHRT